ncbi:MAG: dienelactone hydrolase family protein [Verrucomicrobiales bacterium]|nr:dienelactone hydrolase family protein [Verrucomicrobiales bacterium]
MNQISRFILPILSLTSVLHAAQPATLPGTQLLEVDVDRSASMVEGIDRFLKRETRSSIDRRAGWWTRDAASPEAYAASIVTNRARFARAIGAVDEHLKPEALEYVSSTSSPALVAETESIRVWAVRWPVLPGVFGEGLLLEPKGAVQAQVVAIPDADQTPEMVAGLERGLEPMAQFARRLAENGCRVIVPTLIDRKNTFSGNEALKRFTNQPHREWIYRQAFELGRHVIGYEVLKVCSAIDWLSAQPGQGTALKTGVFGYAEGGLIALYSAALHLKIDACVVSGYYESRDGAWAEPIYRNVFGLLREFGDAEIASLIAPRKLWIEHSEVHTINGPPPTKAGRQGAAPGRWATPDYISVEGEVTRAARLVNASWAGQWITLLNGSEGAPVSPGSDKTLREFLNQLGVSRPQLLPPGKAPLDQRKSFDPDRRQAAQVEELVQFTQRLLGRSESVRDARLLRTVPVSNATNWASTMKPFQQELWDEVIGRLPRTKAPPIARSRLLKEGPNWTSYDVVIDVSPDVFAWGVLLLPKSMKPGERRPVVVCQHGLEGLPEDTITQDPKAPNFHYYQGFAARLADRGFVVFAPHNPYRGHDQFRVLQRQANLLGWSLFSVILAQHDRILDWLSAQPFVDAKRIGFYGLSYGGKTAMRVPALLERYALSICSGDFNDWITKNATVDSLHSYLFTGEYEMPEFNLGNTFSYAEMAAMIAPRPFMVERGHRDAVAPDEWVAHEYARVRRLYAQLGIPERTEIEYFDGPHTIHGVGTFRFLHHHLKWPEPSETLAPSR